MLVFYVDDTILIRHWWNIHVCRSVERKFYTIKELAISLQCQGSSSLEQSKIFFPNERTNWYMWHSLPLTKETQVLLGIFGFQRQHIFHCCMLLKHTYWSLEKGQEEKEAFQQIQVAVKAALSLQPYDSVSCMVHKVSVTVEMLEWRVWQALRDLIRHLHLSKWMDTAL